MAEDEARSRSRVGGSPYAVWIRQSHSIKHKEAGMTMAEQKQKDDAAKISPERSHRGVSRTGIDNP